MATYSSYRALVTEEIADGSLTDTNFQADAAKNFGVFWVFGDPGACTTGCCCYWTVPNYVKKVTFEIWGAGGNGHGACSCDRCQHYRGAQGGSYATKTIQTCQGWNYTICAGGVYRCYSQECTGLAWGCASYVNGCNLSNFCACGGEHGYGDGAWTTACFGTNSYCKAPTANGADFNLVPMTPGYSDANLFCHCHNQESFPGSAPLIGTMVVQQLRECWIRCGCWTVPYGHGAQGGMTTYCGSGACGQGGTGGSGLARITYL